MARGSAVRRALIFWFTGLSGAGKSTVAEGVRDRMTAAGRKVLILDGDDVRARLHRDIGFSREDVRINNEAIAALCAEKRRDYDIILVPVISPFADIRACVRAMLAPGYYEVFCDAGLETVRQRDTKGLYRRAARGEIDDMIGLSPSTPYEPPRLPEIRLATGATNATVAIETLECYVDDVLSTSLALRSPEPETVAAQSD